MVYKRAGRPSLYFEAKQRHGYKQLCAHTPSKQLAQRIEHMWSTLATRFRAWDLLEPVLLEPKRISALYDLWESSGRDVEAMRRTVADVDVEPLVAAYIAVYKTQVAPDSAEHACAHVRHFFPANTPRLASTVTPAWITTALAAYPGKRNTRRKVHSSLSGFLEDCTAKGAFAVNPMAKVARPRQQFTAPVFYDVPTVTRIIEWQPTEARKAFFALVYGTGADVSPAITVARDAINPATHDVRISGTKTAYRDRIVRVADHCWPTFWTYAKTIISGRIFPDDWSRYTVSDWHRQTVGAGTKDWRGRVERQGLKLAKKLPLRKARHHFTVRLLQSGASIRVVSEQVGSDERTVLKHYGPWITSADDRAKAEKMATKHESKQRSAK